MFDRANVGELKQADIKEAFHYIGIDSTEGLESLTLHDFVSIA